MVKSSRVRSGSLSRISLAFKGTPSKFLTPNQKNYLAPSASKASRLSADTVRSSFGGKSGSGWPQNDPSFKTICIDRVLDFLIINTFPFNIKREMLRNPSKNDFVQIFNFIYGYINPRYELPPRFDAEVPALLKALAYPVMLTKSMFTIVGSPHTWPSILAMLAWLTKVVNGFNGFDGMGDNFNKDFDEDFDPQNKFMSLINTFQNNEEENKHMEITKYKVAMEEAFHLSEGEFEALSRQTDRLALQLENMGSSQEEMLTLERFTEQLIEDDEKLKKFNDDLKCHISSKDSERALMDAQLQELHVQCQEILREIESFDALKLAQQYNVSELKKLKNRPQEIDNQIEQLRSEKKMLDEEVWAMEMETSKARKALSESTLKYNARCARLQIEFCEVTSTDPESAIERCEVEILPLIRQQKKCVQNEELNTHNALLHCRRDEEKVKEVIRAKTEECRKLECKVKRLQEEDQFETGKMLEEEEELKKIYEKAEGRVLQARQQLVKTNLYEEQRKLEEAKEMLEGWQKRNTEVRQKGKEVFMENVNLVKKALAEREKLITEHHDRHYKFMTTFFKESKEIVESMVPSLKRVSGKRRLPETS